MLRPGLYSCLYVYTSSLCAVYNEESLEVATSLFINSIVFLKKKINLSILTDEDVSFAASIV